VFPAIPNLSLPLTEMLKMKTTIALVILMICCGSAYSQPSLSFCVWVQPHGECTFNNTKFITSPDSTSGRIFMEVKSTGSPIGAASVIFKIYSIGRNGEEKFDTLLEQKIQPNWFTAWMPYNFRSPGHYTVKVYNESDQMICTNKFELIQFQEK
jgi:hypothetical protein